MSLPARVRRRDFLGSSLAAAGAGAVLSNTMAGGAQAADTPAGSPKPAEPAAEKVPTGKIGNVTISRILLGGNLISGCMHCRDLKYVTPLFRAYCTEAKIIETLHLAEQHGINTVFETGGNFVKTYNKKYNGHMQFIPHIAPKLEAKDEEIKDEIKQAIDSGSVAVYVWGVMGDRHVQSGSVAKLAKAVEFAKNLNIPCGIGSHSLQVPMACEKSGIPCDFYVKTFHNDDYPSAIPKEQRKEYIWLDGGPGWNDNMWCINPEETAEFMKTVKKPWLAFKVLAAGAYVPRQGFAHAFKNGADFIAVGMFDFQIKDNCELVNRLVRRESDRPRPWFG